MRRRIRQKVTFSNVTSMLALFVALGGVSYAAVTLPKNSVGGAQIKANAVTGSKIKNGSVGSGDLAKAVRTKLTKVGAKGDQGPAGPQGAVGPQGPAGTVDTSGFYSKTQADAAFSPLHGTTKIQVSPESWLAATSTNTVANSSGQVALSASAAGTFKFFNAGFSIPVAVRGHAVSVDSFELCYDATNANVTLDRVFLFRNTATAATPLGSANTPIDDDTDRHDATCRTYSAASPVALGPNDLVSIIVRAGFTAAGSIDVSRLTLNLSD